MEVTGSAQFFLLELWPDVFLHNNLPVGAPCGFPSQMEQAVALPQSTQNADCLSQM